MDFFFADDAYQRNPSREGMGPLIATGGICVSSSVVSSLEGEIDEVCNNYGFPKHEEFKWSPGRELWMHDALTGQDRESFLIQVMELVRDEGGTAIVIIADMNYKRATDASSAEEDVTCLLLERVHRLFEKNRSEGIVIVDRPGGGRSDEDRFLGNCFETLQSGTDYVKPDRIYLSVLSTPSELVRLIQVADVITSCTLAMIGGEDNFSPPIFHKIRSLLDQDMNKIGGVGLKIHPDYRYANLYYWLLEDPYFKSGVSLPIPERPYSMDPNSL